jgi:enterochelin esterase-like enzyme
MKLRNLPAAALLLALPLLWGKCALAVSPMARTPLLHGSLVLKSMPPSTILGGRKITTWIYLPPGYADSTERYPVVYLLHGQPGGWTDCFISGHVEEMADSLISSRQMAPAILVAFDANGPHGTHDMTDFCNRVTDGYRAEDFIVQELVPYIDTTYRTVADSGHRALWGYSSGGYGALNLGLRHPDVWNIMASHAGFYRAEDDPGTLTKVLGPQAENVALWQQNSPLETVKTLPANSTLHVYMDAAPREEDYEGFLTMETELKKHGVEVRAVSLPKAHNWRIITQHCRDSLLFIDKSWGKAQKAEDGTGSPKE